MSDTEELTCVDDAVLLKYKTGAIIVNKALKAIVPLCVEGASIRKICEDGEKFIMEEVNKRYRKDKEMKKGIAFPVALSVNNCINHFSPIPSDDDQELLNGDLVKIDFGVHFDGFISVIAHSIVVGANNKENKVTGRKADVMLAAHYTSEAALGFFKPEVENYQITEAIGKICDLYDCTPVEGMLSFQLQQNQIDGEKMIHQNPAGGVRKDVDRCKFEEYEVYGMDVVISTGKGLGREIDSKVSIYKKTDETYNLKLKCSKEFFHKVNKDFGTMPFNLRHFDDIKKARMGVMECVSHKLVAPYPVLWERQGEHVAQFKYTVLIHPTGPVKLTGIHFDATMYKSDVKIMENEEIKALLDESKKCSKNKC